MISLDILPMESNGIQWNLMEPNGTHGSHFLAWKKAWQNRRWRERMFAVAVVPGRWVRHTDDIKAEYWGRILRRRNCEEIGEKKSERLVARSSLSGSLAWRVFTSKESLLLESRYTEQIFRSEKRGDSCTPVIARTCSATGVQERAIHSWNWKSSLGRLLRTASHAGDVCAEWFVEWLAEWLAE